MTQETKLVYAPPLMWSPWVELVNVFGFHGQVEFAELEKGDTQVTYEVRRFPSAEAAKPVEHSAMPDTSFFTYQVAWIRAYGSPFGTGVKLAVSYELSS